MTLLPEFGGQRWRPEEHGRQSVTAVGFIMVLMKSAEEILELRCRLGCCLRRIRKTLDLTQDDVAQSLGLDRSRLSRIETGRCSLTFDELVQFADGLSLDPAALLDLALNGRTTCDGNECGDERGAPKGSI